VNIVEDPSKARKSIGIVFQDPSLDNRLTGRENLEMHAELYDVDRRIQAGRIMELIKLVGLEERAGDLVRNYSGGMKRRLEMARGLIHHPKVLFLDEPTLGLDPQTRAKIWEYIQKLAHEECITIVLTTHYMEEAESLCDRIGIIDYGRIVALGTPKELIREVGEDIASLRLEDASRAAEFEGLAFVKKAYTVDGEVKLVLEDGASCLPKIFAFAAEKNIKIPSIELRTPTLNDVFLHHVGRELREEHASRKDKMKISMRRRMR
jgi:ABC-2 type transport system ATP-binding protein